MMAGLVAETSYTHRQKLSNTNCVANFFRVRLCDVNKPYVLEQQGT